MKIVATSDTHFFVDPSVIPNGDVFIHAGDLMDRGYETEWKDCLAWLEALPHQKKYLVPGNHDFHLLNYPGPALQEMKWIGVEVIGHPLSDAVTILPNGMTMLGSPWVTNLMRWAFNTDEETLREYVATLPAAEIVVSHSPIYGYLDEVNVTGGKLHTGIKAYEEYRQKFNPLVWIHGHIHEGYGHIKVDNTDIYNVSLCDIEYRQRNMPLVLEL